MEVYRLELETGEIELGIPREEGYRKVTGDLKNGFAGGEELITGVNKILPPVAPRCIYGIGLNYEGHVDEWGERPEEPLVFMKAPSAVIGPEESIALPEAAPDKVDFEAELAVVIGKEARGVKAEEADDVIAGVTCANDVTARDCQQADGQWVRAKSFDTFCPLGPCLQTDWHSVEKIEGYLNGELYQEARLDELIFSIPELIEYLSHQFTLPAGTVILTGTPAGSGFARQPEEYLRAGDIYRVWAPEIGSLENEVLEIE